MLTNKPFTPLGEAGLLPPPVYAPVKENEQVLLSLGITADHIAALPMIVESGAAFLVLELRNADHFRLLQPVPETVSLLAQQYGLAGYCIFCRNTDHAADAFIRYFGVIPEATANSHPALPASALTCYLYDIAMIKKDEMSIYISSADTDNRPGAIEHVQVRLVLKDGKIKAVQPGVPEPSL
ncbi:hypothetical protein [Paraflavitalea sp. CAU 1676]|uniref:hypothetical protein n=1 Tax=Paraflavitalea sp. CAU 1676 TaxID=3032598 RepID=UPI0023DCA309|nr:hypothetical protein [Paraflavitalea sp. CAU 1676]MDF2189512.1 hypothetical protein [Paraflavitalea sp. CAU 1676]